MCNVRCAMCNGVLFFFGEIREFLWGEGFSGEEEPLEDAIPGKEAERANRRSVFHEIQKRRKEEGGRRSCGHSAVGLH